MAQAWLTSYRTQVNRIAVAYGGGLSRLALFIIYGWFGALKVFAESPANPLVDALLQRTMPEVPFDTFIIVFGLFEMLIGLLWLIPGLESAALAIVVLHVALTSGPLVLLPAATWQVVPFVPTLEGQYIMKNLLILAAALNVLRRSVKPATGLHPDVSASTL